MDLSIQLTDDFTVRNEIVTQLHAVAKVWLTLATYKAPLEVQSILQVSKFLRHLLRADSVAVPQRVEGCTLDR